MPITNLNKENTRSVLLRSRMFDTVIGQIKGELSRYAPAKPANTWSAAAIVALMSAALWAADIKPVS